MSDTSKKRSRKSKLVPRDYEDDVENKKNRMEELTKTLLSALETEDRQLDSLPNPLHTVLPKLRTEIDKSFDYAEPDTSTRNIKFSVDIEVEECDDDNDTSNIENEDFAIETYKNRDRRDSQQPEWPVYVSDEDYHSTFEKLSKITRALADKIIEVHIRNYLGRFVNEEPDEPDYFKSLIQEILIHVQHWQKSSKLRESILSYKCYVCDIGWWHLGPFQEHIKEHGRGIKIALQTSPNEGCVVAHFAPLTSIKEIPIEGRCWQCMKTWDEHANLKRMSQPLYNCASCSYKTPTCLALFEHESTCGRYQIDHLKEIAHYESNAVCPICNIRCVSEKRLKEHMTLSHFARSDFHCNPLNLRKCANCGLGYVLYTLHTCRKKNLSVSCNYCTKRFPGRILADIHMDYTRKNVYCRVCNMLLKSQCMELEHMARHSKNYVIMYKCIECPSNTFFNDEKLMKEHKRHHPVKKHMRASLFERIGVPRKLFPSLPYNPDDIGPVKPYILGPMLAPLPKKQPSVMERMISETQSAVDGITYNQLDVHGHDYLFHPYNSIIEPQTIPAPKDDTQQQIADDTIAAIQSISDVTVKTEIEDYEYCDRTEVDIVYEEIDIEKEEFLDTMSNAFISSKDVTDSVDDQDVYKVSEFSEQVVTVIKKEEKISELLSDSDLKTEVMPCKDEEMALKKECFVNDFEDDLIILYDEGTTENNDNVKANGTIVDDDITIINSENEIIDISDTEMQGNSDKSKETSDKNEETPENESNIENDGVVVKKPRGKNRIYQCNKCDFKAMHKEYRNHIKTVCRRARPRKTKDTDSANESIFPWTSYPCSKCDYAYTNLRSYILHLRRHKIPPKTCPECLKVFQQDSQLRYHVKRHITRIFTRIHIILETDTFITSRRDRVYQCKKCMEVVKYKKFFKHWENHLKLEMKREVEVECKIERNESIEEDTSDDTELAPDILKHILDLLCTPNKKANQACVFCLRSFARVPYLKRHYVEHLLRDALCRRLRLGTEGLACQQCGEQFNHNLIYKQHMRNHASLTVYRCEICARSFSDSSNFAKHRKVHNMAAAICDMCGAKFFKKEALIKHMEVEHQLKEPIKCEFCPRVFMAASHHRRHVRNVHSKVNTFKCYLCLEKFFSTKDILDHLWIAHNVRKKKIDCPICKRSFRKFIDMKFHLKVKHNTALMLSSNHFFNASESDRKNGMVRLSSSCSKSDTKGEHSETKPGKKVIKKSCGDPE